MDGDKYDGDTHIFLMVMALTVLLFNIMVNGSMLG